MESSSSQATENAQSTTLESEIKQFVSTLSLWEKYLSEIILSGETPSEEQIEKAYSYLLEDLGLKESTEKNDLSLDLAANTTGVHKNSLFLSKLSGVKGVNGLIENEELQFNKNLTIIFGANGSGKSSYTRLLKKAFYSKAEEAILHNIHDEKGESELCAEFRFTSEGHEYTYIFPTNADQAEFEQFAAFDGKCVIKHLDERNQFEFSPAGLNYFSGITNALNRVQRKLNDELELKRRLENVSYLFEGKSIIKDLIIGISPESKINDFQQYIPFTQDDIDERIKSTKEIDEIRLINLSREKELHKLETLKNQIQTKIELINRINVLFSKEALDEVNLDVQDCILKETIAKSEGVEKFKSGKIIGIGSSEWKSFLLAAEKFAKKQNEDFYPKQNDHCILCHQPLTKDANELLSLYWKFLVSIAEESARKSHERLQSIKNKYNSINFELFPSESMLTIWLNENFPSVVNKLTTESQSLSALSIQLQECMSSKTELSILPNKISTNELDIVMSKIDSQINNINGNKGFSNIEGLQNRLSYLNHKEKLNLHLDKVEQFIKNIKWIHKVEKISWMGKKRRITDAEKYLSDKYFNQKYYEVFRKECIELNGNFEISINHTGSSGTSYRQLLIKGRNPSSILSEGEQKVIAMADFLAEMQLSEINKGIILDDPVTSLDEERKSIQAERLAKEALNRQVVILTHDLVFVSTLISYCLENSIEHDCHWIESIDGRPGKIWPNNGPSYEKQYKKAGKAQQFYEKAKKAAPEEREQLLKNGFAALRTSYESMVIFDLFEGVVQRFNERVSVDSLRSVVFDKTIIDELLDSFYQCCRYMEGHSHSDKYAYKKPNVENLIEEINRFNDIKKKIAASKPKQ